MQTGRARRRGSAALAATAAVEGARAGSEGAEASPDPFEAWSGSGQ